jgi:RHS repeat-associated protein
MTSGTGLTMGYNEANRIGSVSPTSGGTEYYGYAPDNKRVYRLKADGTEGWKFYGARGEKLMTDMAMVGPYQNYTVQGAPMGTWCFHWGAGTPLVWFGGRLISEGGKPVYSGRLGPNRASGGRFYPYGEEISSTADDRTKFGTYNRDGFTGLDYADQRFYASSLGRFNTADPYQGSAGPKEPGSWNRFSYGLGDPANNNDPTGLQAESCFPNCDSFDDWGGDDEWDVERPWSLWSPDIWIQNPTTGNFLQNGHGQIAVSGPLYDLLRGNNLLQTTVWTQDPGFPQLKVLVVGAAVVEAIVQFLSKRLLTAKVSCQVADFTDGFDNAIGYETGTGIGADRASAVTAAKRDAGACQHL